jgi:site-specific recombinase XerD
VQRPRHPRLQAAGDLHENDRHDIVIAMAADTAAGITEGAIFRRIFNKRAQRVTDRRLAPRNVAAIVKQGAARLGFDPSTFGGHSLRAGFVTSAVKRGANLIKITDVTGHKSLEMLKTYSRDAEAFVGHAGAGLL